VAIAVHSPYSPQKRDRGHVQQVAEEYGIHHPVYIDNDVAFFNALHANAHPTFYVVDKRGRIRMGEPGVLIDGYEAAKRFEAMIQSLLAEEG
jgi:hypothetical protein